MSDNKDVDTGSGFMEMTANIVAAYVGKHVVPVAELPGVILAVDKALRGLTVEQREPDADKLLPAVPIRKSITSEYLVCLEDGLKFKSLTRHIKSCHGLTPDEYRAKWALPEDYPMVAPSYSEKRSQLAKEMGLGKIRQSRRKKT